MKTLKLIGIGWILLSIGGGQLQAEEGQITTVPPYVSLTDKTQPFVTPVGPNADGSYSVTFNAICDDTTLSVSGTFTNANQTGSVTFTPTSSPKGGTALITYPSSTAGQSNPVTIIVVSSDTGTPGQCTASIWRPSYATHRPLAGMCFNGSFLTGLIYNFASFIPSIINLRWTLLGDNSSNLTSKEIFKFNVLTLKPKLLNKKSSLAVASQG